LEPACPGSAPLFLVALGGRDSDALLAIPERAVAVWLEAMSNALRGSRGATCAPLPS
jgi:hypothetical protein